MSHTEEPDFETHDIYLAAYLSVAGCSFKNRRKQGNRWYFVFTNAGGPVSDMREAFFAGKAMVAASKYADEIRKFKELCF